MTTQTELTCENGHELTGLLDDAGNVTSVRARGAGHRRSVVWAFVDCSFCPLCGAEIRREHGSEIGVVRA